MIFCIDLNSNHLTVSQIRLNQHIIT